MSFFVLETINTEKYQYVFNVRNNTQVMYLVGNNNITKDPNDFANTFDISFKDIANDVIEHFGSGIQQVKLIIGVPRKDASSFINKKGYLFLESIFIQLLSYPPTDSLGIRVSNEFFLKIISKYFPERILYRGLKESSSSDFEENMINKIILGGFVPSQIVAKQYVEVFCKFDTTINTDTKRSNRMYGKGIYLSNPTYYLNNIGSSVYIQELTERPDFIEVIKRVIDIIGLAIGAGRKQNNLYGKFVKENVGVLDVNEKIRDFIKDTSEWTILIDKLQRNALRPFLVTKELDTLSRILINILISETNNDYLLEVVGRDSILVSDAIHILGSKFYIISERVHDKYKFLYYTDPKSILEDVQEIMKMKKDNKLDTAETLSNMIHAQVEY